MYVGQGGVCFLGMGKRDMIVSLHTEKQIQKKENRAG